VGSESESESVSDLKSDSESGSAMDLDEIDHRFGISHEVEVGIGLADVLGVGIYMVCVWVVLIVITSEERGLLLGRGTVVVV